MINLVGKSREQIQKATRDLSREKLIDLLWRLASVEPMLTPNELAQLRRMSRATVVKMILDGTLRAHKPFEKGYRIPVSAVDEWDRNTALFFSPNKSNDKS